MKKSFIILLLAGCCTFGVAENAQDAVVAKIAVLKKEAEAVDQQMAKMRVEILKKDPELQKLHQQILALHRELALRVDGKREMRILILKSEAIEREIKEISIKTVTSPKK
ncbi:MAG: hypothetical protein PHS31_01745 [Victivallaceae bacterium]|nr:hypothetical protein [Victivallaceae bacterium]MDD4180365.1 hypothetical protein [Victivallaceae bacterium]